MRTQEILAILEIALRERDQLQEHYTALMESYILLRDDRAAVCENLAVVQSKLREAQGVFRTQVRPTI